MKSVTGEIVSSTPVSLSRAATIISNFVAADNNGASHAVNAYLRRATSAFGESVRLQSKPESRARRSEPSVPTASVTTTVDELTRSRRRRLVNSDAPHERKTKRIKADEQKKSDGLKQKGKKRKSGELSEI